MDGTGLLLQSISEWWDLMVKQCDTNDDGRLELRDMEVVLFCYLFVVCWVGCCCCCYCCCLLLLLLLYLLVYSLYLQRCKFDQIPRPKKFDALVDSFTAFMSNQQNVENLWRFILEQQRQQENLHRYSREL